MLGMIVTVTLMMKKGKWASPQGPRCPALSDQFTSDGGTPESFLSDLLTPIITDTPHRPQGMTIVSQSCVCTWMFCFQSVVVLTSLKRV